MAKKTGAILQKLRACMKDTKYVTEPIHAYIVTSADPHMSEYVADCHKRRENISGFSGSAGSAVITDIKAAMWTDGRYFLQCRSQMDHNWILMKDGLEDTVSMGSWLCKELPSGSRVGVDSFLISTTMWQTVCKELEEGGISMVMVKENLVDIATDMNGGLPDDPISILPVSYCGQHWHDKVDVMREKMKEKCADVMLLTALDDIAWLLNLRGSDVPYNPVFYSYVLITLDSVLLFLNEDKLTDETKVHLGLTEEKGPLQVFPYEDIGKVIQDLVDSVKGKIWVGKPCYALYNMVPEKRRIVAPCPVALMKATKNPTEVEGMKKSHIRDAVALCEYFAWLEKEVASKAGNVTEVSGAEQLLKFRKEQTDFVSESFSTISSVGPNAAVIHYRPMPETDREITAEEIYLCDSGAQYRDGTTDVTRTMHFGTPTKHEQECFTRVLKGHIALDKMVFPKGTKGHRLECVARQHLWAAGLDYYHGTGHGVGHFLNVHEGPCSISYRPRADEAGLEDGMILSNEPGYYEDGEFGIRIENLVHVTGAKTKHRMKDTAFLTFEAITLVPMQQKMLLPDLLTEEEIEWWTNYHLKCREVVGAAMLEQGKKNVYNWLLANTQPIN